MFDVQGKEMIMRMCVQTFDWLCVFVYIAICMIVVCQLIKYSFVVLSFLCRL